ncbi:histidine phosphatase family protein [Amphritea sp. 2_MG-2023]|uniref:SixA phosphatase family protein n=1 Tax=Amphritea TaxID=515417 RepID=UPI001C06DA2D|nr:MULTISPECIES: histidine phosphatase family protein [Amphritea]MBU2963944.1 histidine phosphatase family protein [Amphritea atlantica]MDO6419142.1 histidine phosphatase family protein [Amphritea sp. 2_MG-2023]MDX2422470.1 histidine phosphatase family protein [Amphritea sp.]
MRMLTLLRHAKSSWKDPTLSDFDRPLNKRGKRDLPLMAARLQAWQIQPDLILSSGARRAITTAEQVARMQDYPTDKIIEVPELYHARVETLINLLQGQSDHYRHLMVVGHNPTLELAGYYLTQENIANLPTCGVMQIALSITRWEELAESCGTLERLDYPKLHQ